MEDIDSLMEMISSLPATKLRMVEKIVEALAEEEVANKPTEWMSTEEAAKELCLTSATVRTYLSTGKLEGRRISDRKLVVSNDSVQKMRLAQTRL